MKIKVSCWTTFNILQQILVYTCLLGNVYLINGCLESFNERLH